MTHTHSCSFLTWLRISFRAMLIAFCLLLVTTIGVFADTVRISDPVGVLNQGQITTEGAKLPDPLDVYTTSTFSGSAVDFISRTISAHLISTHLIVVAIDIVHHYLAIVNGASVPLSKSEDSSAGTAFKNNFNHGDFTGATLAAIRSLESSLGVGGSPLSGLVVGIIVVGLIILVIITAIVRFVRRLLGIAPPPTPVVVRAQTSNQRDYGDGRDNFGSGAVGEF